MAESLRNTRSKTKGQIVEVTDENSFSQKVPYLIFGGLTSIAGILIYYLLPLAFLTLNLALILGIFFTILLGMIVGLTLIAFNLQKILEAVIVHTLLFWERASMKILILKNLTAHRESNKMTSIIYSLTLGCIILIIIETEFQIQIATT